MSNLRILNFQYSLQKRLPSRPGKRLKDKQLSDLLPAFELNVDEMRRVFDKIDRDHDERISPEELESLLEALGKENVAEEVSSIFQVADTNRDRYISFDEFMDVHGMGVTTGDIRSAFWAFDQNKDGRIDAEEVMAVMRKLGESCSIEDCRRMVKQVDRNGDGLVDMDDFMAMMTSTMKRV